MPAPSQASQQAAGIALQAKKTGETGELKGPAKQMSKMSTKDLRKFASTKRKGLPKHVKERENFTGEPLEDVQFWVVMKPHSHESNVSDICTQATPFQFHEMCMEGLSPDQVHGFYIDQPQAQNTAKQLLIDLQDKALALEAMKEEVTTALQKKMNELQKLAEMYMKSMKTDPDNAGDHHVKAEGYLAKLKKLRETYKMVDEAKKQLAKRDYDKDGEVETPEEEYKGSVDKAIKQAKTKKK